MTERLLFFDLETTGVRHWKDGIHQIAGAIKIDGEIKERFDFKVQPNPKAEISDEALAVGHVTREIVNAYPPMGEIYRTLMKMLGKYVDKFNKKEKFHLVGYNNASFDNQFLRAFFVQNFDNYFGSYFWADSIDCYVLASKHFMSERDTFVDFKQSTVATRLGMEIDAEKLHDANYDIDVLMFIYDKLK